VIDINVSELLKGSLIFFRIGGILFALPFFGEQPTPVTLRILMALGITFCISYLVPGGVDITKVTSLLGYVVIVGGEVLIGLTIGFFVKVMIDGLVMAASLVGYQMGFGTASLMMPGMDQQTDGFSAFHRIIVLLIFLGLNLHHLFFKGLMDTFIHIPLGGMFLGSEIAPVMIDASANIFLTAIRLAAPVLIALTLAMTALGLMARTVPQMNVFVMSFPVSFFIGLLIYLATLPLFPGWMQGYVENEMPKVFTVIKLMATK
jgi:flagellar biosynthetic protein FliR